MLMRQALAPLWNRLEEGIDLQKEDNVHLQNEATELKKENQVLRQFIATGYKHVVQIGEDVGIFGK